MVSAFIVMRLLCVTDTESLGFLWMFLLPKWTGKEKKQKD
jgi:hypothetical protein